MEELNAMKYCLQFAKSAYDQETERQRHASSKADYLLKYLTLMTTAFSITISVVSKMSSVHIAELFFGDSIYLCWAQEWLVLSVR